MERELIICVILLGLTVCGGGLYKIVSKLKKWKQQTTEWGALEAEAKCLNISTNINSDSTEHHVLCLGNSITLHYPASTIPGADPFWKGEWGMCASRRDCDYVHRMEKMFKKTNVKSTVIGENIAVYERDFSLDLDSLIGKHCQGKDIIILRIGENVKDIDGFYNMYKKLVDYCLSYTSNIYLTGCYWKNLEKERTIVRVAREKHLPYIPLFWIDELYRTQTRFDVGDTIYDTKGQPYPIKTKFIISHPNDKGMKMIATSIYDCINCIGNRHKKDMSRGHNIYDDKEWKR